MTKIFGYTNGEISRLYILSTSIVVVLCLLISLPIETTIMEVLFREMMLQSISGWIALWIDPMIYVQMFVIGLVTYAVVALLEYKKSGKYRWVRHLKCGVIKKFPLYIVNVLNNCYNEQIVMQ